MRIDRDEFAGFSVNFHLEGSIGQVNLRESFTAIQFREQIVWKRQRVLMCIQRSQLQFATRSFTGPMFSRFHVRHTSSFPAIVYEVPSIRTTEDKCSTLVQTKDPIKQADQKSSHKYIQQTRQGVGEGCRRSKSLNLLSPQIGSPKVRAGDAPSNFEDYREQSMLLSAVDEYA
ncbi:hypothetical protein T265_07414 [Opisthorchis viverrini]|uniref:Uncharacterized protein n=1 Tax=Opisthorchis viverrini TaxID=6198 RepID=A0A075ABP8_OPIVI|nr:hypothetical protein T265_07414 [Opisthorchis viverrini]KER25079.1 hypothetical protein T265_07414 [Opisthorchis viverrini]